MIQSTIFKGGYMETKLCFGCVQYKSTSCFHKAKKEKGGFQYHCIDCSKQYHAKRYVEQKDKLKVQLKKYKAENKEKIEVASLLWKKNNPDKVKQYQRTSNLRKNFGLSMDEYEEMLAKQKNLCAICLDDLIPGRTTHIDHNHNTGQVRGLLCMRCNLTIGLIKDHWLILDNAQDYVGYWSIKHGSSKVKLIQESPSLN